MSLHDVAARSSATPAFLDAIAAFQRESCPNEWIRFDARSPVVKIERTLTQLLAQHPDLVIERVQIDGRSGCEFFRGELTFQAEGREHRIRFDWDCRWKAQQQGWTDYFGFHDQIRAAREFGYDCFRQWEMDAPSGSPTPSPLPADAHHQPG